MLRARTLSGLAAVLGALVAAVPALAATAHTGHYNATCPQGFHKICGEAAFNVSHSGKQIDKGSSVPWPNDPANPGIGICGRGNPFSLKAIPIHGGAFSFTGVAKGKKFTWTGKWSSAKKVTGTVKWAGCATVVRYTATTP